MTEASVVRVVPSFDDARVLLATARRFAADGEVAEVSTAGRQLLLYQSCIAACDAALIAAGMKIHESDGGHALRLSETTNLLGLDTDLLADLDEARQVRSGSADRAGFVLDDQVAEVKDAAHRLIDEVDRFREAPDVL